MNTMLSSHAVLCAIGAKTIATHKSILEATGIGPAQMRRLELAADFGGERRGADAGGVGDGLAWLVANRPCGQDR